MDKIEAGVINRHRETARKKMEKSNLLSFQLDVPMIWLFAYISACILVVRSLLVFLPHAYIAHLAPSSAQEFSVGCLVYMVVSVVYLLYFIAVHLQITFHDPISSLPAGYVGLCGVLIAIVVIGWFFTELSLVAQAALVVATLDTAITITKHRKNLRSIVEEIYQEKVAAEKGQSTIKYCEVCAKESQYDLCLDCEAKYKAERHKVRAQIMRAKQAYVPATLTLKQWLDNLNMYNWRCAYCQTGPYQVMEHYLPITQGGGTTQENCVPACYACNSKKSDRHPETQQRPAFVRPKGGRK